MSSHRLLRPLMGLFAVLTVFALVTTDVDARAGASRSSGSRGSNTFNAPPATSTAPKAGAPIERSMTQPGSPGVTSPAPSGGLFGRPGGLFGGGLFGGLAAGFLGAGLFGLLFGHGMFGGLGGGFISMIGLLLQLALVFLVARLIWTWWQRRNAPAYAGPSLLRGFAPDQPGPGPMSGGSGGGSGRSPVTLEKADFDGFESLLGEIQTAYGAEDLGALRARATPEMVSYFADDLAGNASRGVVNRVSDVKLLQGDLSEAWREGDVEYATVAMRYALKDFYVDRTSGRVVEGDDAHTGEATELWTFRRDRGGHWLLSAIQQT